MLPQLSSARLFNRLHDVDAFDMDSISIHQYSEVWFREAQQAYESGELNAAAQLLERLISINPGHADGLHLRGLVAFAANQPIPAQIWISRAITAVPNPTFYNSLCIVQFTMKAFSDAAQSAREGLSRQPDSAILHYHLALALQFDGDLSGAAHHYRQALDLDPANSTAHNNLGTVLNDLGDPDAALQHVRRAIELAPGVPAAHSNLGKTLMSLGEMEGAALHFRRAIAIAPENFAYYRHLVQATRLSVSDPCFVSMANRTRNVDSLPPVDQMHLHFAFGQALADNGSNEQSFEHFQRANAIYRASIGYDEERTLDLLRHIPNLITAELLDARRDTGDPSRSPVFIVGMPRSGSTLVEQILASHPNVFAVGERPEFKRALHARMKQGGEIDIGALRAIAAAPLTPVGTDYVRRIHGVVGHAQNYQRITDKYLFNFAYLGFIHLALPNARFIHIRRDPVETCLSIYSKLFSDVPFAYDLGELGRYYRAYAGLMEYWRSVVPEQTMIEIQYEDLVDDFEPNVRRMLAHCGLAWDERCMQFSQTRRQVLTMSARQVREPLFRSSLRRWRPDRTVLQPLLDGLASDTCEPKR